MADVSILTDWKHSAEPYAAKHQVLAVITCPRCKHEWILSAKIHRVAPSGAVTPSVVCPCNECDWHEFVILKSWTPPEWQLQNAMNGMFD
jgi:RNase P subunit RPR2